MGIHRKARQRHAVGDLAIGHAVGHQPQNGAFALTQFLLAVLHLHRVELAHGEQLQDAACDEGVDRGSAAQHAADRERHFKVVPLFQDIAGRTGAQGSQDRIFRAPGRNDQNAQTWIVGPHLENQRAAIAVGQLQIHQRQRHRLLAQEIARFLQRTHNDQIRLCVAQTHEHELQPALQQRLILHHKNGDGQGALAGRRQEIGIYRRHHRGLDRPQQSKYVW